MEMSHDTESIGPLEVMIVLHTAATPPAAEWQLYEASLREWKRRVGGDATRARNLVISDGGAPNTQQRHFFQNDIWEGRPVKMSLLSNSLQNPMKRAIASALTWMNQGFKVCAPHDLPGALAHLEILDALDGIWERCAALQAQLPSIMTLELIARALRRPRLQGLAVTSVRA